MAATGKGKPQAQINVVPLVDVCLVLLIIFMVVTPMLHQKDIKLPSAENAVETDERNSTDVIVSVKLDGSVWLQDDPEGNVEPYPVSLEELQTAMTGILEREPYRPVLIKADKRLSYGEVKEIMLTCQSAGAKTVKLGAKAEDEKTAANDGGDQMASARERGDEGGS